MSNAFGRRMLAVAVTAIAVAGFGPTAASSAHAAAVTSQVYVVHGIPATPVDVYVNGKKTLSNFKPGDVAGPLTLPAGSYDLALTKPGEPIAGAILKADGAAIPGGKSISIVAHLDASGTPKITPFVNDTSMVAAGKARLIVRHTAAAPAVDVRAGGKPVFTGLTNPNEAKADVAAGTVSADVVLAGTTTVVLGPKDLMLKEGTVTIVYATGSAEAKNLALVAQVLTGMHQVPGRVPSGDGGAAATGVSAATYILGGVGLLLIIGAVVRLRGRRATA
ncbi:DUF4397 domain-containing protein [Hamadaea tsunoensis]|uniref:DUF4397 domain-containing protein n=1 Tax=Hamadaea tsunoensis TaxID=53368 RepID=UPI00041C795B|nr:DUF4397 domain-containing protein [Hamadaea tsunoensis]